ncbi:MAG: nuclear transport factor 2 family protein [Actinobacteria bacterium]|nr:nuclear transport factor 2 family protein [Actinomycetota bacterium]
MPLDLQAISDRIEIEELLVRYSRALDFRDFAALETLFTADATFDAGSLGCPTGSAEIRAMIEGTLTGLDATQHLIGKSLIELNGDEAEVRTYLISQHIREATEGPVKHYFLGGEYADRVVRTPEGWRIAYRRLDRMWKQGDRAVISGK